MYCAYIVTWLLAFYADKELHTEHTFYKQSAERKEREKKRERERERERQNVEERVRGTTQKSPGFFFFFFFFFFFLR